MRIFRTACRLVLACILLCLLATSGAAANLTLYWDASVSPGVTGYRIHYGPTSGTYDAQLDVGLVLTGTLTTLTPGQTYFIATVAYDATLNSSYSNEISYAVPPEGTVGLIAAYGFETGSGATATDSVGTSDGTISGAVWTTSGKFGQALTFDGVDDVVTVPDSAAFDLTTGMTTEAWVYPTSSQTGWKSILQKDPGAYYIYGHSNTPLVPSLGGILASTQVVSLTGVAAMPLNTWTHLAVTYDGTTMRAYVDGVLVDSIAAAGSLVNTTGVLRIGAGAEVDEVFAGRIDEVRIYNRALSATEIQTDMVTPVVPPPGAPVTDFTGTPTTGTTPLAVTFTNTTTGDVTSWAWTFGDGGTSTAQHPIYTYTAPGTYTVALMATGPEGSDTLTRTAYIVASLPPPPVANFTGTPTTGTVPLAVTFSNTTTGDVTSWAWTFGDGGTSTVQNPSHTYTVAGTYTVALTATGPGGAHTLTRTDYITASLPPAPVANFTGTPTTGAVPLAVTFTNTTTGNATSWAWTFGDGGTSTAQHPSYSYTVAGTYTVALTATGPGGNDTLTRTAYIVASAPVAPVANFIGTPPSGVTPLAVTFTNTTTGNATSWAWTFGDGATSTVQNPSYTYTVAGTYTVALTATGPGGAHTLTRTAYIVASAAVSPPVSAAQSCPFP